jgi:hypothetical protein
LPPVDGSSSRSNGEVEGRSGRRAALVARETFEMF